MSDFPEIRVDVGIDDSSIGSSFDKIIAKTKSLEASVKSAMTSLSASNGGAGAVKTFEKTILEITRLYNSFRKEMSEGLSFSVGMDTTGIQSDFASARSLVVSSLANLESAIQQSAMSGAVNYSKLSDAINSTQDSLELLGSSALASKSELANFSSVFDTLGVGLNSLDTLGVSADKVTSELRGISSAAEDTADSSNTLASSVKPLASALENTGDAADDTAKGISNLGSGSDLATRAVKNLVRELLVLVSIRELKDLAVDAIDLSSSLVEVKNVVDTVFGSAGSIIEDFASTSIDSFGLAEASAKEYVSTIGAILGATGLEDMVGADALAEMAVNLTKVTADFASFRNMGFDEVFAKIKSAITGETEAIKSLGVALYDTDMQEYMLRNGIEGTWASLDNNTKILLRYNKIMSDSSFVHGDFAKTSDTFANSTRVLKERWTELLTLWGNYLIPVVTPAIGVLGGLLSMLSAVTTQLASLFGWSDYQILSASTVSSTQSMLSSLTSSVDSADELGASVKAVGVAAKKSLAPFSELNILSSSKSGSASDNTSFNVGSSNVPLAVPYTDNKASSYLDELSDKLKDLKISKKAEEIVTFLEGVWDFLGKIAPLAEGVLVGILSHSILKKLVSGWGDLFDNVGGVKKLFSGNFTGNTKTKIEKLAIAAGVATVEFKLLQAVFETFVLDKFDKVTGELDMTFGDVALTIGAAVSIVGIASVALYALLGPVGLLVAGFTLALAGIKAYTDYQDTVFQASLERNLGGTEDFSEALDGLMEKNFSEVSTSLGELGTALDNLNGKKEEFDATVGSFDQLLTVAIGLDGNLENLPDKLQALGDSVVNQAKSLLDANYQWAVYGVILSGLSEEKKAEAINQLTESYNNSVAGVDAFSDALKKAAEDGEVSAEEMASLSDSFVNIQDILGTEAEVDLGIDINIEDIDLSDFEQVKTAMNDLTGELELAEEDFATKRKDSIAKLVSGGMSEDLAAEAFDTSEYSENYREALKGLQDDIALIYVEFMDGVSKTAQEVDFEVDVKGIYGVSEAFYDTSLEIVKDLEGAGATVDEIVGFNKTTMDKIKKSSEDFQKVVEEAYPDDFWSKILDFIDPFDSRTNEGAVDAWMGLAPDSIFKYAEEAGTYFSEGFANGVADPDAQEKIGKNSERLPLIGLDRLKKAQDSNSPSEETRLLGLDFSEGYALGISDNSVLALTSSTDLVTGVLGELSGRNAEAVLAGQGLATSISDGFTLGKGGLETSLKSLLDSMSDILNNWVYNLASSFSDIATSLSTMESAGDLQNTSASIKSIKIPKLASGAVIRPNSEFISILGDQKKGVNIESPLSTMIDAFTSALDSRGGAGFSGTLQIPVYVNGDFSGVQVIETQELEKYRSNGR